MNPSRSCPALLVSAAASNQGKTTVTAALARHFSRRGKRVRVFKVGPDFLDPLILQRASGHSVYQLDLWMVGESHCRQLLYDAAADADLILIEGVMGLFDGQPCSADLAQLFGIPVLAVIDASAMAQTFAAVAFGLRHYRADLPFFGVVANRVGSARHAGMLLPEQTDTPMLAALPRDTACELPSRHLGLLHAAEVEDLDARLDAAADALQWRDAAYPIPSISFDRPAQDTSAQGALRGVLIAVARDEAFSFIYPANLDCLESLGAELVFFSPLRDEVLPQADSVYLPGGYPELHLAELRDNQPMRDALRAHHAAGKPVLAECGGMLYLLESLRDSDGQEATMTGILPGNAQVGKRLAALALQSVTLPEGTLRGHSFHYSQMQTNLEPIGRGTCPNGGTLQEPVYRSKRLTASYVHFYFPSDPTAVAQLFLP
ncbi:MAG TPA: cobyrinate a,c-diamide synthase [Gallionella sp.]|nr:cobyrinate a,c-diamide synthase [Gallionella sp.]